MVSRINYELINHGRGLCIKLPYPSHLKSTTTTDCLILLFFFVLILSFFNYLEPWFDLMNDGLVHML